MNFKDLPAMQRLAIAQALYKRLAEMVSTKDPESLRSEVDGEIKAFYEATGAKSYDVNLNGQKCGTFSVNVAKESTKTVFDLVDDDAFGKWITGDEVVDIIDAFIDSHIEEFVKFAVETTGEIPDGVEPRTVTTPEYVKGTTIRIDPRKVAAALGNALPSTIAGLLEG